MPTPDNATLTIRPATPDDLDATLAFYYQLIDDLDGKKESPRWEKDVWPSRPMLEADIAAGSLHIALLDGEVVGGMVLDHARPDGYDAAPWNVPADEDEAMVAHLVAVSARHQGKGIGTTLMRTAADICRDAGARALRLDVIDGNAPAARLYERVGFQHISHVQLYYEDTGWDDFDLYELEL